MPSRNILTINCDSSPIKFALINKAYSLFPLRGLAERLGSRDAVLRWKRNGDSDSLMIPNADHRVVFTRLLLMVQDAAGGEPHGIGYQAVHGGGLFTHATRIDNRVVEAIRATMSLAPLHNPVNLQGIEATMMLFSKLPYVAVFDVAFHRSLPEHAYRCALPEALYRGHGVRRYGFHGTSHRYVSHRVAEMAGLTIGDSNWLDTHPGNGSSTCVTINGQSLDAGIGLTPLEGLVVGTRSGDVDPNLHSRLTWTLGWSLKRVNSMLNNKSGLLGLSDLSNDVCTLKRRHEQDHLGVALATEVSCHRLVKPLAAMSCVLSQLDGVIFIGGIGENSSLVCAGIAARLQLPDLRLDQEANARCVCGAAGLIQATGHPRVLVTPTNEGWQIALNMLALFD